MATRPELPTLEAFDAESAAWQAFANEMRETLDDLDTIIVAMERLASVPAVSLED